MIPSLRFPPFLVTSASQEPYDFFSSSCSGVQSDYRACRFPSLDFGPCTSGRRRCSTRCQKERFAAADTPRGSYLVHGSLSMCSVAWQGNAKPLYKQSAQTFVRDKSMWRREPKRNCGDQNENVEQHTQYGFAVVAGALLCYSAML
jgi:hypothetical protein